MSLTQSKLCSRPGVLFGIVPRWSLTLLLILDLIAVTMITTTEAHQMDEKKKLCGPTLTEAIDLVCVNGFNYKFPSLSGLTFTFPRKRKAHSSYNQLDNEIPDTANEPEDSSVLPLAFEYSPFLSSLYKNNLFARSMRRLRREEGGIYDECCRKSCSYNELAAYCRQL